MLDRSALDEAVRRFPVVVLRARSLPRYSVVTVDDVVNPADAAAIRHEYRLILAERAKQRRKAA